MLRPCPVLLLLLLHVLKRRACAAPRLRAACLGLGVVRWPGDLSAASASLHACQLPTADCHANRDPTAKCQLQITPCHCSLKNWFYSKWVAKHAFRCAAPCHACCAVLRWGART